MKTTRPTHPLFHGFTLLEVIGVLSVVGILAALLTPKILGAIDDARLASDILSIKNVRSATETYFRRYLTLAAVGGVDITSWTNKAYENWDRNVLLREQLLEKAFTSKLATSACVRVVQPNTNVMVDPVGAGTLGSLGSQYGNNGVYDLLREYAANSARDHDGPFFASAGGGQIPGPIVSMAGSRPAAITAALAGGSSLSRWLICGLASPLNRLRSHFPIPPFSSRRTGLVSTPGLGPLFAWINLHRNPTTGPPPSPGMGTASTSYGTNSSPSHSSGPLPYNNDTASASAAVEIVLRGVSIADAYRLSLAIDGPTQSNWALWDSQGKVKYNFDLSSVGTVYIYVAAR